MTGEERIRQTKNILVVAGIATILIAAVLGLTLGKGQASDEADPALSMKELIERAHDKTLTEVREDTAKSGFKAGRKSGARQGGRAGRRAGESDGAIAAQLKITSVAESAAANAQAELDSISAPPPPPAVTSSPQDSDSGR